MPTAVRGIVRGIVLAIVLGIVLGIVLDAVLDIAGSQSPPSYRPVHPVSGLLLRFPVVNA